MSKSKKGSAFERETCVRLSLWWSEGERDDLFWRTGGSGARANVRGQKGKRTEGQHGDIAATDPAGADLIKVLTIELKRGYSTTTVFDLIDKPKKSATQGWEKFFEQTLDSFNRSGSLSWLLIHKRDRREAIVFFPDWLFDNLVEDAFDNLPLPIASFRFRYAGDRHHVYCMRLATFLNRVHPDFIRGVLR